MSKCSFPDRVLYVQKREVLKVQRAEVERWFAKRLPECDLSFAVIGDRPTGSFDCVIAPAAASTFETIVGVKDLRWLHFMGAGVDAVAKEMEERTTVRFTTSAGVNADSIAEYVMGGILYFSKRLGEFDRYKGERRWQRHWLRELSGQRLLCLGVGAVGKAVAIRAKAFGMRVTGMARTIDGGGAGFDALIDQGSLYNELSHSDVVVCALSYTQQTHHIINAEALAVMQASSLLINVARGGVVDTEALVIALQHGAIGGAVLDVFEEEPLPLGSPIWTLSNVLMTPHVSGTTDLYLQRMLEKFEEHLVVT